MVIAANRSKEHFVWMQTGPEGLSLMESGGYCTVFEHEGPPFRTRRPGPSSSQREPDRGLGAEPESDAGV